MFSTAPFAILGVSLAASLSCELLCWLFMFSRPSFKELMQDLERQRQAEGGKGKKKGPSRMQQLQLLEGRVFLERLKQMGITLVLLTLAFRFVTSHWRGVVVAKLPFTPPHFISKITHRGLTTDDLTDCSAHAIYILCQMAVKTALPKLISAESQAVLGRATQFAMAKME